MRYRPCAQTVYATSLPSLRAWRFQHDSAANRRPQERQRSTQTVYTVDLPLCCRARPHQHDHDHAGHTHTHIDSPVHLNVSATEEEGVSVSSLLEVASLKTFSFLEGGS